MHQATPKQHFMKKLSNNEAELKKSFANKKMRVVIQLEYDTSKRLSKRLPNQFTIKYINKLSSFIRLA